MVKLAQKLPSGCTGGEIVGRRATKHREKTNGIYEGRTEGRQVNNICGDAHQYGRADQAREDAHNVYDPVCLEFAGSILPGLSMPTGVSAPTRPCRDLSNDRRYLHPLHDVSTA